MHDEVYKLYDNDRYPDFLLSNLCRGECSAAHAPDHLLLLLDLERYLTHRIEFMTALRALANAKIAIAKVSGKPGSTAGGS